MLRFLARGRFASLFPQEIKSSLLLSVLLVLSMVLAALVYYLRVQPVIPLWYTLPQREAQLAAKEWLFLIPGLSLVVLVVHAWILGLLQRNEEIILKLFAWATVAILMLFAIAFLRIIVLIT